MKKSIIIIFTILTLLVIIFILLIKTNSTVEMEYAKYLFQNQNFEKAINIFTEVIDKDKNIRDAYFFRGASYTAINEWGKCVDDFSEVIRINSKDADAYWSRGYCYANLNDFPNAINDDTKALELGTDYKILVYYNRSKVYFRSSRFDDAEKDLKSILELDPKNEDAKAGLDMLAKSKTDPNFDSKALIYKPIYLQPAYGNEPLSEEVKIANQKFIDEMIKAYGSRESAFYATIFIAKDAYESGDYETAMRRYNQAWLLDSSKPEVYLGFSSILNNWGYADESSYYLQKSKQLSK